MGVFDKIFKKKETQRSIPERQVEQEKTIEQKIVQKTEAVIKEQIKRGYIGTYKKQMDYDTVKELKERYIAFDVETTGLSPMNDKIIEVAAVLFENGEITQSYTSLVNPEVFVPYSATAINHITNEMVQNAPKENIVFAELVEFLGDALKQQTSICAHNASFDMNFLSETLMRLGYDGKISYVDTLSLSRSLIKGLHNYKQDTVAMYFDLVNNQSHRAVTDAEICGKILWNLLQIEEEKRLRNLEKSKPCVEEMEICAYIQNCIMKNGGDSKWLGFYKNSSNYVDVSYLYSILKFKCAKKGKYIIVETSSVGKINCNIEPCTMSEGGSDYVRVYFNSPFELEPLESYLFDIYAKCRKSALDYFKYNKRYEAEHKNSPAMLNHLSDMDVAAFLESAEKRKMTEKVVSETIENSNDKSRISREDIIIQPIHNRVPLSGIRNKNNWEKGYDEGYPLWEKGDNLRKEGNVEEAIKLFDQARYNGYDAPVLYDSYAIVYHKLKDYANEIDILDEGIVRERKNGINVSRLEARREKAIQLLYKQQEAEKKKLEKEQIKNENIKIISETSTKTTGRAILQLTDDMTLIKRYNTIAQAVRETGVNSKSIRDAAKGVQKHAGGYVWKYADEIGK